jgi:hypothetical protein
MKPKFINLNLCAHKYGDGTSMNDNLQSILAPAGTTIDILENCEISAVKKTLTFTAEKCQNVEYAGGSYVKYGVCIIFFFFME